MKSLLLLVIFVPITAIKVSADSEGAAIPVVTASAFGPCFFASTPKGKGSGAAYELQPDGSFRRLWKVTGWFTGPVYLSQNGRYLVRMGDWAIGSGPSTDDLAVAFYDRGKRLARYSTADLVKDPSKVVQSTSHYCWLANENLFSPDRHKEPAPALNDDSQRFALKTIDGIIYVFDITTGKIESRQ